MQALHFSSGRTYSNSVLVKLVGSIRYLCANVHQTSSPLSSLNARRKFRETLGSIEPSFINSIGFANISNAVAVSRRQWHSRSAQERSSRAATTATRSDDIIKVVQTGFLPTSSLIMSSSLSLWFCYPSEVIHPVPGTRYHSMRLAPEL